MFTEVQAVLFLGLDISDVFTYVREVIIVLALQLSDAQYDCATSHRVDGTSGGCGA